MNTIPILLLLVLSNRVLCSPVTYLNDAQPLLEGSLSDLQCRPLSGDYNWQMYINATEPQVPMVGNQTTLPNASVVLSGTTETLIQRFSLLSTATLAGSAAQPTETAESRCQIIARTESSQYRPSSMNWGPFLLQPALSALYLIQIASSHPVFRVTIRGRLPDAPDIPHSYYPIHADNSGIFSLPMALLVKISIHFGTTQPKQIECTLWQIT